MAAHVPALLHGDLNHVLVIGLGTGQTASRFLMHGVARLDCVDIESQLITLVKEHFESAWMDDPRVRLIVEDGRNFLTHTDMKYDLIAIEVGQVFRPGLALFYTSEFYHETRKRLKENGLVCQFVQTDIFRPDQFAIVVRTFLHVFPQCVLWYNRGEFLLIGTVGDDLKIKADALATLSSDDTVREDLVFSHWGGPAHWLNRPEVFLGGFLSGPSGLARLAGDATIYRDDLPHLEYTTSHRHLTTVAEIVDLVRSSLEPVRVILDRNPTEAIASSSQSIREKNLRDIMVGTLLAPVNQLQSEGKLATAIERIHQALKWNSENVEAHYRLAVLVQSQGKLDEAIRHFRRALAIDPGVAEAHKGLGRALVRHGLSVEGISYLRKALQLKPDYADARYNLGNALLSQGEFAKAIEHYRKVLKSWPDFPAVYNNLGYALLRLHEFDEAIVQIRHALRLDPDYAQAHYNLGVALKEQGRLDLAHEHLHKAVQLDPKLASAVAQLRIDGGHGLPK